jgi:hypothetical protein
MRKKLSMSIVGITLAIGMSAMLGCGASAEKPVATPASPPPASPPPAASEANQPTQPTAKAAQATPAEAPATAAPSEKTAPQKPVAATAETPRTPALAAEFLKSIDLRKMPRINETRVLDEGPTHIHYSAKTTIAGGDAFCSAELASRGWKPVPGEPMVTEQYAERLFEKDGFYVRLSMGAGADEGVAGISLYNLGNIDLRVLPRLGDAAIVTGSTPVNVNYQTDASLADATKYCREQMSKLGWREFGSIDGPNVDVPHVKQLSYFQNAARLDVMIAKVFDKPAGPTHVAYMAQHGLTFDLPVMQDATDVKLDLYSGRAEYQSPSTPEQVFAFYDSAGKRLGWKPQEKGTHVQKDSASMIAEDQPELGFGLHISRKDKQSKISYTRLSLKQPAEVAEAEEPKAPQVAATEPAATPESKTTVDPTEEVAAEILKEVQKSLKGDLGDLQKELKKLTGKLPVDIEIPGDEPSVKEAKEAKEAKATVEIEEEQPSPADLKLPKLQTSGEISFDKTKHPLKHAVAYRVIEDNKAMPVIVFSEEPIDTKKLKEKLSSGEEVWLSDLFGFKMPACVQVRLQKDYTSVSAYVEGASLNISSSDAFQTDFKVIGPRLRGTIHQREKKDFFDKEYQIDGTFDVEMINAVKK